MSIIADALKKADAPSGQHPQESPQPLPEEHPAQKSHAIYRLALVGCAGLVLLGIAHVTRRPAAQASAARPTASAPRAPETVVARTPGMQLLRTAQGEMALTGTLRSVDGKSLALINNEVVQQGDRVRGMTVVRVNPDSVELQDEQGKTKRLELKD